jgi:hypothetical protein
MLKRLQDPANATVRAPSKDAINLMREVVGRVSEPVVAEIGVG